MRRLTLAAAISMLALGSVATASAQVRNCNTDNRAAGTIVGALVGATAGGVIANNTRSHRGYGYRGHRGFRGNRGFRGHRGFRGSRRGNQELGIIAGALVGGVIGNQVAASNSRNCQTVVGPNTYQGDPYAGQSRAYNTSQGSTYNEVLVGGNIDHNAARLGDPYGGRQVISGEVVNASQPVDVRPRSNTAAPTRGNVFQPVCEQVFRETQLPDGQRQREPIEVCQYSPGGEWIEQ